MDINKRDIYYPYNTVVFHPIFTVKQVITMYKTHLKLPLNSNTNDIINAAINSTLFHDSKNILNKLLNDINNNNIDLNNNYVISSHSITISSFNNKTNKYITITKFSFVSIILFVLFLAVRIVIN